MDFANNFLKAFIPLFVAVDIIGLMPFFVGVTEGMPERARSKVIRQSVLTASAIAVVFVIAGQALFDYLTMQLSDFMIAGGAVLFLISAHDLVSREQARLEPDATIGVVPLGTPMLSGPAVLATAIIMVKTCGYPATILAIVLNLLIAGAALQCSGVFVRVLGRSGSRAVSKIMSLVLSAYGVMMIRKGIMEIIQMKHNTP